MYLYMYMSLYIHVYVYVFLYMSVFILLKKSLEHDAYCSMHLTFQNG